MHKWGRILGFLLCTTVALQAQEGLATQLDKKLYQVSFAPAEVSSHRFAQMRFYRPQEQFQDAPSVWQYIFTSYTDATEQAVAMYLFNMYVSTKAYGVRPEGPLTLNFLGVLDTLSLKNIPIKPAQIPDFYQAHQESIRAHIARYFQQGRMETYKPDDHFEQAALRALESSPIFKGRFGYAMPQHNRLQGAITPSSVRLLTDIWHQTKHTQTLQAVIFNILDTLPQNYDTKLARATGGTQRFFRWVQDECNYSSYMTGKALTEVYLKDPKAWGNLRIYLLTARPKSGAYLKPARGERFKLSNGQMADRWQYHTALLAVVNTAPREYAPVVLDSFLGGEEILSLDLWLSSFSSGTVFFAEPFFRSQVVEDVIKEPSGTEANGAVWIEDKLYFPMPIEQ